ncbi:acyltransferase [Dactylosporangium sp. NPDC000555]|uniref:acyltransferase family protein n=1 Tax=Dactylosporangium sp. NPDC000555 TaxID=3154260 RepID=UPI003328E0C2
MSTAGGEMVAAGGRATNRTAAIDGIRGLAAAGLMTVHVGMFSGLLGTKALDPPRPPSNFLGGFFVSGLPSFIGVFFVLPAMFLYLPLAKAIISGTRRPPQGAGFVRRLMRLLPAYYAMCLVAMLALNRGAIDGVWFFLRPFLLLQVYLPSPFTPKLMNGMEITWTVPSMVQWYLALPLIAWAVHRFAARGATPLQRARRLMLPVPVLIGIGLAWLFFVKANGWDNRIVFWWPQGFAPTIGIGMGLAVMLALSSVSPGDTPKVFRVAVARPYLFWLGAVVVYLVNCARPFSVIGMDAIYSVSGLLVTYLMVAMFGFLATVPLIAPGARPTLVNAVLGLRPLAFVGRVSYGIYLWHFAVMHFYLQPGSIISGDTRPIREMYGKVGFWELELVTFAGSLLLATLSFYLLEQPIAAWADRRLRRAGGRAASGGKPRIAGRPAAVPEATVPPDHAAAAEAVADRDAIRANLVDLERSFGRQLLAGSELTGGTRQRWDAATADLTTLWDLFTAYSLAVDAAVQALGGGHRSPAADLERAESLLTGASVVLSGAPPPLAERHITDRREIRLTPAEAVTRMQELFARTAEVVSAAETVWNEAGERLKRIGAQLDELPPSADAAAAAEQWQRLQELLLADPLALWRGGRVDTAAIDALREQVAALAQPAPPAARR